MAPSEVFRKNVEALAPFLPAELLAQLKEMKSGQAPVHAVFLNEANDLSVAGTRIYNGDALSFALRQVAEFSKQPLLLRYTDVWKHLTEGTVCNTFISRSYTGLPKLESYDLRPDIVSGHGVVFGIGLGYQIPLLLEKFAFKNLILADNSFEFLYASLHVVDWRAIVDVIAARGGGITFVLHDDPGAIVNLLQTFIKMKDFHLIEGTVLFPHIANDFWQKTIGLFLQDAGNLISYNGWFEDELTHLNNILANKRMVGHKVLAFEQSEALSQPAFIVGSGPSFDKDVEYLKRHRDSVCVFSAGSSILPLLRSGITPDFHCELENVEAAVQSLKKVAAEFDLSSVTLLASYTCFSRIAELFENIVFFNREGDGAPALVTGEGESQISLVAPSCVNTACRLAIFLGFKNLCLVGADFGSTDPRRHHAQGTVYRDAADASLVKRAGPLENKELYAAGIGENLAVEGNFGGTAFSTETLMFMKSRLEVLFEINPGVIVTNFSDGAKIRGTRSARMDRFQPNSIGAGERRHHDALASAAVDKVKAGDGLAEANYCCSVLSNWLKSLRNKLSDRDETSFLVTYDVIQAFIRNPVDADGNRIPVAVSMFFSATFDKVGHYFNFFLARANESERSSLEEKLSAELDKLIEDLLVRVDSFWVKECLTQPGNSVSLKYDFSTIFYLSFMARFMSGPLEQDRTFGALRKYALAQGRDFPLTGFHHSDVVREDAIEFFFGTLQGSGKTDLDSVMRFFPYPKSREEADLMMRAMERYFPDSPQYFRSRAIVCLKYGKLEQALEAARHVFQSMCYTARDLRILAKLELLNGNLTELSNVLKIAVERFSSSPSIAFEVALHSLFQGDWDGCEESALALTRSTSHDPDISKARFGAHVLLAYLAHRLGDGARSTEHLEKAKGFVNETFENSFLNDSGFEFVPVPPAAEEFYGSWYDQVYRQST